MKFRYIIQIGTPRLDLRPRSPATLWDKFAPRIHHLWYPVSDYIQIAKVPGSQYVIHKALYMALRELAIFDHRLMFIYFYLTNS